MHACMYVCECERLNEKERNDAIDVMVQLLPVAARRRLMCHFFFFLSFYACALLLSSKNQSRLIEVCFNKIRCIP